MLFVFLLHLSYLGLGLLVSQALPSLRSYELAFRLPLAYFLGLLLNVGVLYVAAYIQLNMPFIIWLLFYVGLPGVLIAAWKLWKAAPKRLSIRPSTLVVTLLLLGIIWQPLRLLLVSHTGIPELDYDPIAIWSSKAIQLYYGENLWTEFFLSSHRIHPHRGYPLYVPIFILQHFVLGGAPDVMFARLGMLLFELCGFWLFVQFIRSWSSLPVALMTLAILLFQPAIIPGMKLRSAAAISPDVMLSIMIVFSLGFYLRYRFWENRADLWGTVIALSSASMIKHEGMAWLAVFYGVLIFSFVFSRMRASISKQARSNISPTNAAILALPILVCVLTFAAQMHLRGISDVKTPTISQLPAVINALPKVGTFWLESFFEDSLWSWDILPLFLIPLFTLGLVRNIKNPAHIAAWSLVGHLLMILLVLALLDSQSNKFDMYANVTYPRLIVHIFPATLLFAVILNSKKFRLGKLDRESLDHKTEECSDASLRIFNTGASSTRARSVVF